MPISHDLLRFDVAGESQVAILIDASAGGVGSRAHFSVTWIGCKVGA